MGGRTPDSYFIRTPDRYVRRTLCSYDIRIEYPKGIRTEYPNGGRIEYPKGIRTEELWITEIFHDDSYLPRTEVAALLEGHRQLFKS